MILLFLRPHYQVFRRQRAHAWVPLYIAVSEARREWPYEGENQPVLVSEQTSTGHLYLPVLVEVVTSTAPRSDQYYFVLICIELRSSSLSLSLYETTLMALEYGNKSS